MDITLAVATGLVSWEAIHVFWKGYQYVTWEGRRVGENTRGTKYLCGNGVNSFLRCIIRNTGAAGATGGKWLMASASYGRRIVRKIRPGVRWRWGGGEWFGGKNKVFVDVGEGLPTNAEISKIWEIRGQSGQCWSFPGPESQESKIVCIFFPRSIWSLGVPPFDPGEKSWSAKLIRVISADPHLTPPCINPRPKPGNRKSSVSSSLDRFGAWEYHHSIRVKILDRLCENKFWKKIVMKILKQTTSMKNVYENFHENIVDEKFSKKKIIKKKTEDFFCNFLKY